MSFRHGITRMTIVGVVIVELILAGTAYRAWTEVNEAEQRLAALPIPGPFGGGSSASLEDITSSSPEEIARSAAEATARSEYEYTAGTVVTKKSELYLLLGALLAFPILAAIIFQTLFWVGRAFRSQPA